MRSRTGPKAARKASAGRKTSAEAARKASAGRKTSAEASASTGRKAASKSARAPRSVPPPGLSDTRLALMRAAEHLMAEQGIDFVSLRQVSATAGQLNNSAVLYHFGSRDALIDAILERHSHPIQARWSSQLDFIERQGITGLRPLVEMLVLEIVNKLDDPDGGWEYISICAQLSMAPQRPLVERDVGNTPTVQRLVAAMLPYYPVPPAILPLRFERLLGTIYPGIVGWRRHEKSGQPPVSRDVFASELVDTVEAIVTQPLSAETRELLEREAPASRRTR